VKPSAILETILYARDLDAAETFYGSLLGLERVGKEPGRHVFFRVGNQMLLIFNPDVTILPPGENIALPVPPHGAVGPGHLCFRASAGEITKWREHLESRGVAIEMDFKWPSGGRSLYFRDSSGNSIEFAEPRIWNLDD
jgi:catechol 2,3-dioxygenase-like lactoylglutathione lyase family enzyme